MSILNIEVITVKSFHYTGDYKNLYCIIYTSMTKLTRDKKFICVVCAGGNNWNEAKVFM
jgi:hypothetical protein